MKADDALLAGILNAPDLRTLVKRMRTYYGNRDRADRTSRPQLYLHLGLLAGTLERVADERDRVIAQLQAIAAMPPDASAGDHNEHRANGGDGGPDED